MKGYEFQPYEARDGFRWRLVAANNRIVADSAEAYSSLKNCERAIAKVKENLGITSQQKG